MGGGCALDPPHPQGCARRGPRAPNLRPPVPRRRPGASCAASSRGAQCPVRWAWRSSSPSEDPSVAERTRTRTGVSQPAVVPAGPIPGGEAANARVVCAGERHVEPEAPARPCPLALLSAEPDPLLWPGPASPPAAASERPGHRPRQEDPRGAPDGPATHSAAWSPLGVQRPPGPPHPDPGHLLRGHTARNSEQRPRARGRSVPATQRAREGPPLRVPAGLLLGPPPWASCASAPRKATPASQGCCLSAVHPGKGVPALGKKIGLESLHLGLGPWVGPWLGLEVGQQTPQNFKSYLETGACTRPHRRDLRLPQERRKTGEPHGE